jgi:hypothetical protein
MPDRDKGLLVQTVSIEFMSTTHSHASESENEARLPDQ